MSVTHDEATLTSIINETNPARYVPDARLDFPGWRRCRPVFASPSVKILKEAWFTNKANPKIIVALVLFETDRNRLDVLVTKGGEYISVDNLAAVYSTFLEPQGLVLPQFVKTAIAGQQVRRGSYVFPATFIPKRPSPIDFGYLAEVTFMLKQIEIPL